MSKVDLLPSTTSKHDPDNTNLLRLGVLVIMHNISQIYRAKEKYEMSIKGAAAKCLSVLWGSFCLLDQKENVPLFVVFVAMTHPNHLMFGFLFAYTT